MIQYPIPEAELRQRIQDLSPRWLTQAAAAHDAFRQTGQYQDGPPNWSDIKQVYMQLQFNKCAYCERELAGFNIEHDVEHYRPKRGVRAWPTRQDRSERNLDYEFSTGEAWDPGYYWLAYEPLNYMTACKSCNSTLKRNYFPIAATRGDPSQDVRALNQREQPDLIYPIGPVDEDPEALIGFLGPLAVPRHRAGPKHRRARVTIDFFRLNERDLLLKQRARRIVMVGLVMQNSDMSVSDRKKRLDGLCERNQPHTACTRAFRALWLQDEAKAKAFYDESWQMMR